MALPFFLNHEKTNITAQQRLLMKKRRKEKRSIENKAEFVSCPAYPSSFTKIKIIKKLPDLSGLGMVIM